MLHSCKLTVNTACAVVKPLLAGSLNLLTQQTRNTVILKRKYPIRLHKIGSLPHKMKHKDFIYEVVENTNLKVPPPLNVILTQYVQGYGEKGEMISLKPNKAYNEFLLPGLAVYASPDNVKKLLTVQKAEKTYSSIHVPLTMTYLRRCVLMVNMSIENPWVIEKWHIRANFRRIGIVLTEDSITLPEKEISGPNLDNEGKEFYVTITINKTEKVIVRCRLSHVTYDLSKELPHVKDGHLIPRSAIFPEDQEVLDSLPRPKYEDVKERKKMC